MQELAIRAHKVTKQYSIGLPEERAASLPEAVVRAVTAPFRRMQRQSDSDRERSELWALKDVSFEIPQGQVVGVIGRNGAGKSTLLKILSRITDPSSGEVDLYGRVASLLEVGTGFHPELTGRENIFLNGAILGMARAEIARKFDEIVAFSEIERFLDTPVKRYSSGMYTRLAFAVAAHLDPEILLVDEVLAVGDASFQRKCLGKMGEVAQAGRTVVFVSHNLGAVQSLCQRVIWLQHGRLVEVGPSSSVIAKYLSAGAERTEDGVTWSGASAPECPELALRRVRLLDQLGTPRTTFRTDDEILVEMDYDVKQPVRGMRLSFFVVTDMGEVAFCSCSHNLTQSLQNPGSYTAYCTVPARLLNRRKYYTKVGADVPGVRVFWEAKECLPFHVDGVSYHGSSYDEVHPGTVCPQLEWSIRSRETPELRVAPVDEPLGGLCEA